jgi:hypothetical protein
VKVENCDERMDEAMHQALEKYQQHTTEFLDALALFPERNRSIAPAGEWSAAFIVHHLSDGETHFAGRYLLTLGADKPPLVLFNEDWYPEVLRYEQRTLNKSLAAIVGLRTMVLETLSLIDDASWNRAMVREDGSAMTLAELVLQGEGHFVGHIDQLRSLAATL